MWKRGSMILLSTLMAVSIATPVAAGGVKFDRIRDFETVLAVRKGDDFPIASLMRGDCSSLVRVQRPNGSAVEIQHCRLNNDPVMIPEFQGQLPTRTFVNSEGACVWSSDYWFNKTGADVLASSFWYVVTPSGHVFAVSEYPAQPLVCE